MVTCQAWPEYVSPETGSPLNSSPTHLTSDDGSTFPIVNGIPSFVPDETYAGHFGWQWNRFPKTQLDSHTKVPISEDRIRLAFGDDLWASLKGRHVLECGCGAGRFSEVLLNQGAMLTSVDLSSAVEANASNCPISGTHRIAKADIMRLPFQPRQYDVVMCLGVVQHTPNPEATLAALYTQVRPGGYLVIDHYTHEWRWTSTKPIVRAYLKRQKPADTLKIVERMVDAWLPWHRRFKGFYPAWFLLCRFSPITTYYHMFPQFTETQQREWALLDTHDSLTDFYKHLRTREEIQKAMEDLGMEDVHTLYAGNGVEGRGKRPLR